MQFTFISKCSPPKKETQERKNNEKWHRNSSNDNHQKYTQSSTHLQRMNKRKVGNENEKEKEIPAKKEDEERKTCYE